MTGTDVRTVLSENVETCREIILVKLQTVILTTIVNYRTLNRPLRETLDFVLSLL